MSTTSHHVHIKFRTWGKNREDGLFATSVLACTFTESEAGASDGVDYTVADGRLEVWVDTDNLLTLPRRIEDAIAQSGYQLTGPAFDAMTEALSGALPNPAVEWIHMVGADMDVLKELGLSVRGHGVRIEVIGDSDEDGWRTLRFLAGSVHLEVYLDIRYERGGAYQFTSESRKTLGLTDRNE